ncbi:MAG: aspartate aminotransferase family protein [Burkholderiales bacterium]|nr:aspartate aminotransferase family protein [Burkholderiales bacterium]
MTSAILRRQLDRAYPVAVGGHGIYIRDSGGKRYLDACGGAAVSSLGHNHPAVIAAMRAQLGRVDYVHSSFFSSTAAEDLADDLVRHAPIGVSHVTLVSGGSEAAETALKLARQAAVERGDSRRINVISRRQSYHGNTLGALAVSGNVPRRRLYGPLLFGAHFTEPCFEYRFRRSGETSEDYGLRVANALEQKILELGPDTVLAFIAETVVGATSGATPPVKGYFRRIREICDRYGCLLILDEVMCGMGRTGTLHACAQEGVAPDLMTVAKGLGSGVVPIGAVFVHKAIHDAIAAGSKTYFHGFTYMAHPLCCAAALAVQETLRKEDLLGNVQARGGQLRRLLDERLGEHPNVGDIRGRGLLLAIEFVSDRLDKTPFAPDQKVFRRVSDAALDHGLMIYGMGGTVDGYMGDHILLAPPYIVRSTEIEEIVDRLEVAVRSAIPS